MNTKKPSFAEIRQQILAAYHQHEYQLALDKCHEIMLLYPENSLIFRYWKACFLSLLGREKEAISTLRSALSDGFWITETDFNNEADFENIRGFPEFAEISAEFGHRQSAAQAASQPHRVTRTPETLPPADGFPLLLSLHGRGGSPQYSLRQWQPAAEIGWVVSHLISSQLMGFDAYCWDDRALAMKEIRQHLKELQMEQPINSERIVVAGFSAGGGLAIELTYHNEPAFRGFIAVAPALISTPTMEEYPRPVRPRGVILAGEKDSNWFDSARTIAAWAESHHIECHTDYRQEMGHEFPSDFSQLLHSYLDWIVSE